MTNALERDMRDLQALEEKFDPEMRFRPTLPPSSVIVKWLLIILSGFHYYTAGFGLLRETTHRGVHLAFVLGLIFLVFAAFKSVADTPSKSRLSIGGVPLVDTTPESFAAVIKSEYDLYRKLLPEIGVKPQAMN